MTVILLANGPSLANVDMSKLAYPTIGLNRSWKVCPDPTHHLALDYEHYKADPEVYNRLAAQRKLWTMGAWPVGKRIKVYDGNPERLRFSTEEKDGAVVGWGGKGSVAYVGLQLAYWLGYRRVYFLGLDLSGKQWNPDPWIERQNEFFRWVPSAMQVFTAGSPESRAIFPKADLSEVYEPAS